jgi:xylulokinase
VSAPLVVGVDVGSQGTCAQALEPDGTLVATTRCPHALSYPRAGWAEQECSEWSSALVRVLSEMRSVCAGREIVAISFGSQLDGLVACSADGEPLRPALIWCDRRAADVCLGLDVDADWLRGLTGCNLDPGHVGPKIAWLARHEPDVFGAAEVFALPGAWVAWKASGVLAVDPSNASSTGLLDPRTRAWAVDACAALDVEVARLPAVPRCRAL